MEISLSFILISLLGLLATYLSGSVLYAIPITRLVTGKDIRELGNKNPGTSNVVRNVGKGWGFLVSFLDAFKVFLPLLLARVFLFTADTDRDFAVLFLMGIAGVLGHCKPIFFRFKGGGGIGPLQGVLLFFIPVEYLVSMLIGGTIVLLFLKKVKYKFGQWTPVMFVILTPFLTLLSTLLLDIPLFAHISIGGHSPSIVVGSFVLSLTILALNMTFMRFRTRELKDGEHEEKG
ncbi:MAG: glycerol-3-phosphate acyltransferase [Spirochaetales bacterium]|nr:glycerol-3-phosphate acyltransferase [Spirochaetales bacterium]